MPLAFDLADKYRVPAIILADGILGQMMEPVVIPTNSKLNTQKLKLPKKDWALTGADGRKQNIVRSLWLGDGAVEQHNYDLQAKYRQIEKNEIRCEQSDTDDADIILVAYGICARIAKRAAQQAREQGIKIGCIRPITLWPFPSDVISKAADKSPIFLVVEMSCGQMVEDVRLAVAGKSPVVFWGRPGGGIVTVEKVLEKIQGLVTKPKKK
jgi:2-oxoglutarate ferredoxin oxidoreductase subunit alpha